MTLPSPSEREALPPELCERFRQGDRQAFLALYEALAAAVRSWARRFFASPFEQEEAVQEIWLHAHRQHGAFDPARGPLRAWLRALAWNRCKEILRARGRRPDSDPARTEPIDDAALDAEGPAPDAALAGARLREAVERFSRRLPADEARVLERALIRDLSNDEVAREIGLPVRRCKYLKKKVLEKAAADPDLVRAFAELSRKA